jgi:hypothetical protein
MCDDEKEKPDAPPHLLPLQRGNAHAAQRCAADEHNVSSLAHLQQLHALLQRVAYTVLL